MQRTYVFYTYVCICTYVVLHICRYRALNIKYTRSIKHMSGSWECKSTWTVLVIGRHTTRVWNAIRFASSFLTFVCLAQYILTFLCLALTRGLRVLDLWVTCTANWQCVTALVCIRLKFKLRGAVWSERHTIVAPGTNHQRVGLVSVAPHRMTRRFIHPHGSTTVDSAYRSTCIQSKRAL